MKYPIFWCERHDLLCSYSKGDIFTCEDNMLFSNVKISSFRAKAHLVFHWCLYNKIGYLSFKCEATKYISVMPQNEFLHFNLPDNVPTICNKYSENVT